MISTIGSIALGGAFGAVARYGVNISAAAVFGHGFPWATLIVNIAGSFMMGALIAAMGQIWQPPEALRVFMVTGFLGAFTTFSTFSLDSVSLWEKGQFLEAGGYMAASILLSIGALVAGLWMVRTIIS